jgi:phosphatidylethanolamine-binding protein (PEBP) family uncharacterized protein
MDTRSRLEAVNLPDSTVLDGLGCHGPNVSPALAWSNPPAGTRSFAFVLDDYEAGARRRGIRQTA